MDATAVMEALVRPVNARTVIVEMIMPHRMRN